MEGNFLENRDKMGSEKPWFFLITGVRPLMQLLKTAEKRVLRNRGFSRLFKGGLMV